MKIKPFKFSAASVDLSTAIRKVVSVVSSGATPTYAVAGSNGKLYIIGIAGEYKASLQVLNASSSSEGVFGAELEYLEGVAKGRNTLELEFDGKQCNFKAVKTQYSGHIVSTTLTGDILSAVDDLLANRSDKTSISSDLLAVLQSALALSSIKDVYHGKSLVSYIQIIKGKLRVTCFDAQHFTMATTKVDAPDMSLAIPASQFALLNNLSDGTDIRMTVSHSGLSVSSKTFNVVLPATQSEDKHFHMVADFLKALPKPVYSCHYDYDLFAGVTDNLMSLYKVNTTFSIVSKRNKELSISLSSAVGGASESLKVSNPSGEFEAQVDPRLFKDILDLAKPLEDSTFSVSKRVFILKGVSDGIELCLACSRIE